MTTKPVEDMTHDDIAEWAASRIRRMGYPFAFANMTSATAGEQPDVLGLNAWADSILVEVKVSRSDFLADKKKPWRQPGNGIGKRRVYLTTKGLMNPSEVPYGWELWEIQGKNRPILKVIKGRVPVKEQTKWGERETFEFQHCCVKELGYFSKNYKSFRQEAMWALKIIKRMQKAGYPVEDFSNGAELKRLQAAT